ncbi:MAG: DUF4010 domain-containing protein [Crocinitomicaceae bacterium]
MLDTLLQTIPKDSINFLLVVIFSLLIGLEQRNQHNFDKNESRFGTDRTFTLIGILGYVLYVLSPQNLMLFMGGGIVIGFLMGLYYTSKMKATNEFGITSIIIAFITYCLAPLIYTQSNWLVILIVVSVLILAEMKKSFIDFSKKLDQHEFSTLAKFLVIAGVILPLLPNDIISENFNFSPYKFWLAIVAVSGISYISYLLKKFVFPKSGILLTGILGGLYSSTATTIILARQSKKTPGDKQISAAIILATTMMYLRIFLLALFFNQTLAWHLAPAFAVMILLSGGLAFYFSKKAFKTGLPLTDVNTENSQTNPLEFKTSLLFGALFIFFAVLTSFITQHFGGKGINVLSFLVGVTDIDPFIINLLQSKFELASSFLVMAIVNATTSNNLLKMIYGLSLSDKSIHRDLVVGFGILVFFGLVVSFVFL